MPPRTQRPVSRRYPRRDPARIASAPASSAFKLRVKDPPSGHPSSATAFAVGDYLRMTAYQGETLLDNWLLVTARDLTKTGYVEYTVTRQAGTAGTFPAGTAIVNYGQPGAGLISLSADGTIGAGPNITLAKHPATSSDLWGSGPEVHMRVGNLRNSYGQGDSDLFGIGIGRYGASGENSIIVDTAGGIRMFNNTTKRLELTPLGVISLLDGSAVERVRLDSAGVITVGREAASQSNVRIESGIVKLRNNTTDYITLDASGVITVGRVAAGQDNIRIESGAIKLRNNTTDYITLDASGVITIGRVAASQGNVLISGGAISLRVNTTERIGLTTGGVMTIKDTAGNAVFTFDASGYAELTTQVRLPGTSSSIAIGSTPPASATSGTGIWIDRNGLYALSSGTEKVRISSTGIRAGSQNIFLDDTGLYFSEGESEVNFLRWEGGSAIDAWAFGMWGYVVVQAGLDAANGVIWAGDTNQHGTISVICDDGSGSEGASFSLSGFTNSMTINALTTVADQLKVQSDLHAGSGLYVGSTAGNPPDNDVIVDGGIAVGSTTDPGDGNVKITGKFYPGFDEGRLEYRNLVIAANGASAICSTNSPYALVIIAESDSEGNMAMYLLGGGAAFVTGPFNHNGNWTTTKDTVNSHNVYRESSTYMIQNKKAASRRYRIIVLTMTEG